MSLTLSTGALQHIAILHDLALEHSPLKIFMANVAIMIRLGTERDYLSDYIAIYRGHL